jgi:aryl-alcohol dehydrogenase-like predicted oxidoreductase
MTLSRRAFLAAGAAAAATAKDPKTGMPTRVLGKTGARVSILGFGSGSRFLMYKEEEKALEALNRAIDAGINYIDTAQSYGNGESERRIGLVMKTRRKQVWLVTKIQQRRYDQVMRAMEESLRRLQTDQVDLVHMHGLQGADDLAAIEAPEGALKAFYRIREEKMARFIGVTCHYDPQVLRTLLERHDLDCTQMALNAARVGAGGPSAERGSPVSFETVALPVALRKKMGVTAMKVFAQDKIPDATASELVRYALSLPVACAVIGMPKLEFLEENLRIAKAFQPMPPPEMKTLSDRLSRAHKARLDRFFAAHQDA